jgi:hypothetical protein
MDQRFCQKADQQIQPRAAKVSWSVAVFCNDPQWRTPPPNTHIGNQRLWTLHFDFEGGDQRVFRINDNVSRFPLNFETDRRSPGTKSS